MILLCNIIDLIQLKGFMELSSNAYKLLTRMFKWKNVSIEKWLTFLWESRRLSHALCVSPICEAFQNSLEHFNELSNIESWTRYLQGNHSSLIGFQQIFSFLLSSAHKNSCCNGDSFQNDITADDVQKAALELISNVSVPNHSTFLAGYLYYDLCPRLVANGRLIEVQMCEAGAGIADGAAVFSNFLGLRHRGLLLNALGCSFLVRMTFLICLIILPLIFVQGKPSKAVVDTLEVLLFRFEFFIVTTIEVFKEKLEEQRTRQEKELARVKAQLEAQQAVVNSFIARFDNERN